MFVRDPRFCQLSNPIQPKLTVAASYGALMIHPVREPLTRSVPEMDYSLQRARFHCRCRNSIAGCCRASILRRMSCRQVWKATARTQSLWERGNDCLRHLKYGAIVRRENARNLKLPSSATRHEVPSIRRIRQGTHWLRVTAQESTWGASSNESIGERGRVKHPEKDPRGPDATPLARINPASFPPGSPCIPPVRDRMLSRPRPAPSLRMLFFFCCQHLIHRLQAPLRPNACSRGSACRRPGRTPDSCGSTGEFRRDTQLLVLIGTGTSPLAPCRRRRSPCGRPSGH